MRLRVRVPAGVVSVPRRLRAASVGRAVLLCGGLLAGGCSDGPPSAPDRPPAVPDAPPARPDRPPDSDGRMPYGDLDTTFPDSIGPYHASGAVERNHAEVNHVHIPSARRQYLDGERELVIEVFDARAAPVLAQGFLAARQLESDSLDELVKAERVAGHDALLTWTRAEAESAVQVMLPGGVLAQLRVWPADRRDHALSLLAAVDLHALARRRRRP